MKFEYYLIYLIGFIQLSASQNKNNSSNSKIIYRLPENIIPLHYDVKLEPHFNNKTFTGFARIEFKVKEETEQIILHVDDLILNENNITVIKFPGGRHIKIKNIEIDFDQQQLRINLLKTLQLGSDYYVEFKKYTGKLHEDDLRGFVYNEYMDEEGNQKNYAFTNLEPAGARRVFPCFDEPDLKAIFFVKIIRPGNYSSLSNMPLSQTYFLGSNRYLDIFERTPEMSTHLFAVVVSDFICTEKKDDRIRICGRKSEIEKGRANFALDLIPKTLKTLEEFTGINYDLPKLDIVALPNAPDRFGAMENWGLITFSEKHLLYDNETNSKFELNEIAQIITHELSHQWFGNLVTLKWWKYLWLNEGFATYFQHSFFENVESESNEKVEMFWNITRFLQNDYEPFKTRALNYDVESTSEIKEKLFDAISYQKGACIIRMMESFLTKPVFKIGIQNYLLKQKYSTAEPSDLYYHFQRAAEESGLNYNVSAIMETWDSQSGFPLVTVTRNYKYGTVTIKQNDFISIDSKHLWQIPITYFSSTNLNFHDTVPDIWLTTSEVTIKCPVPSYKDWILINKNSTGYYKVNYDIRNWNLIADYLMFEDFEKIPVTNRAQLVDDSLTLANILKLPFSTTLYVLNYLQRETHYLPFIPFFEKFDSLWKLVQNTDLSNDFQNHMTKILNEFYKKVTINESPQDSNSVTLLRPTLIYDLCKMGSITCRNNCHDQFEKWQSKKINLTKTSTEREILCGAVMYDNNTSRTWDHLYKEFNEASDKEQKEIYLTALGCSENDAVINKFLDSKLYNTKIFTYFLYKLTENSRIGVRIAFNYFKKNAERIAKINYKLFDSISESNLCDYFNTEELLEENLNFLKNTIWKVLIHVLHQSRRILKVVKRI